MVFYDGEDEYTLVAGKVYMKMVGGALAGLRTPLGTVSKGEWHVEREARLQMRNSGCWGINAFVLEEAMQFGIRMVRFEADTYSMGHVLGWILPQYFVDNGKLSTDTRYDRQYWLSKAMLSDTPELARKRGGLPVLASKRSKLVECMYRDDAE